MHKHIKLICRACETCITNKTRAGNFKVPLLQLWPATKPFEIIAIDTVGGFKNNNSTKECLHLLLDHFERYAYIGTSKTQVARDFVKLIKTTNNEKMIDTVLSDQYAGINSSEFKQYLKSKNIDLIFLYPWKRRKLEPRLIRAY